MFNFAEIHAGEVRRASVDQMNCQQVILDCKEQDFPAGDRTHRTFVCILKLLNVEPLRLCNFDSPVECVLRIWFCKEPIWTKRKSLRQQFNVSRDKNDSAFTALA